jgi:uncharacterized protein YaiI (UPF0178 family)
MKVLIDADACPVVDIAVKLCRQFQVSCLLLCDTAHTMHREGASILIFDKGADSVDFSLVNRIEPGDLVITQDYGLAAMCLARGADVLRQDGVFYTEANMDGLLESRHFSQKIRRAGGRTKGPKKRTAQDDQAYLAALDSYIKEKR